MLHLPPPIVSPLPRVTVGLLESRIIRLYAVLLSLFVTDKFIDVSVLSVVDEGEILILHARAGNVVIKNNAINADKIVDAFFISFKVKNFKNANVPNKYSNIINIGTVKYQFSIWDFK